MIELFSVLQKMPGYQADTVSQEELYLSLKKGNKLIAVKIVGSEIQVSACLFVKDDVIFNFKFTDSFNEYIVLTLINATSFNEETFIPEYIFLKQNDLILVDVNGELNDATITIPYLPHQKHMYSTLDDIIYDIRGTKKALFFNDPVNPFLPI